MSSSSSSQSLSSYTPSITTNTHNNTNATQQSSSTLPPSVSLTGHTDSVLCLSTTASCHYLLSGSEDASARIWDVATLRSTRCIKLPVHEAITSVQFVPKQQDVVWLSAGQTV